MDLAAVRVTASAAGTWAIVIVAVICLAFWLVMVVAIAPRPDVRKRRQQEVLHAPLGGPGPVPVSGGMHVAPGGRSVAPSRDAPAMEMPTMAAAPGTEAPGAEETPDDLPTVPGQRRPGQPAGSSPLDLGGTPMPAQREPATDQAVPGQRPDR